MDPDTTSWWFQTFFNDRPYLGTWSNLTLTNSFQMGWRNQVGNSWWKNLHCLRCKNTSRTLFAKFPENVAWTGPTWINFDSFAQPESLGCPIMGNYMVIIYIIYMWLIFSYSLSNWYSLIRCIYIYIYIYVFPQDFWMATSWPHFEKKTNRDQAVRYTEHRAMVC